MISDLAPNLTLLTRDFVEQSSHHASDAAQNAIDRFVKAYDLTTAEAASQEIDLLLELDLDTTELNQILHEDLECSYHPSADGISISEWLRLTQSNLQRSISAARQRRIPRLGEEVRVLRFPLSHALGWLERPDPIPVLQDETSSDWAMPRLPMFMREETEFLASAQGDILVAASEKPILVVIGNGQGHSRSRLPPGDWSRDQERRRAILEQIRHANLQRLAGHPTPSPRDGRSQVPDLSPLAHFQPDDLYGVWLGPSQAGNAEIMSLAALRELRWLRISQTEINDTGLMVLEHLSVLETLILLNSHVSDTGLMHLRRCTKLRHLYVNAVNAEDITDRGLGSLQHTLHLTEVWVNNTHAGDAGLPWLGALNNLRHINLFRTQIDDRGLEQLANLPALETLLLAFTPISDAGISRLRKCRSLQWLDLSNTAVTDKSLIELCKLTNLRRLNLMGTNVSHAGISMLRRALPMCTVLHELWLD